VSKKRYTKEEHLKIKYYKAKIKEIPYLQYKIDLYKYEIEEIDANMENLQNGSFINLPSDQTNYNFNKYNVQIDKKDSVIKCMNYYESHLFESYSILNELTDFSRKIAIDLLVDEIGLEKVKQKYFLSNPYQSLNDELRAIDNY